MCIIIICKRHFQKICNVVLILLLLLQNPVEEAKLNNRITHTPQILYEARVS